MVTFAPPGYLLPSTYGAVGGYQANYCQVMSLHTCKPEPFLPSGGKPYPSFDGWKMNEPTELINPLKRYNDTTSAQAPDK